MRPDVCVIVHRDGVMVGGVVVEVKLTDSLSYAQQGYAEALIYAREYPAFLKGWPKAVLVTTAPVAGEVRRDDEVVAVGWPGWVPDEVVEGILEPIVGSLEQDNGARVESDNAVPAGMCPRSRAILHP